MLVWPIFSAEIWPDLRRAIIHPPPFLQHQFTDQTFTTRFSETTNHSGPIRYLECISCILEICSPAVLGEMVLAPDTSISCYHFFVYHKLIGQHLHVLNVGFRNYMRISFLLTIFKPLEYSLPFETLFISL